MRCLLYTNRRLVDPHRASGACRAYRYDLGSGRKVLRSRDPVSLGPFHRLSAKRYGRDGVLRVDAGRDVSGVSPGNLRSLNVGMPLYLGHVANINDR